MVFNLFFVVVGGGGIVVRFVRTSVVITLFLLICSPRVSEDSEKRVGIQWCVRAQICIKKMNPNYGKFFQPHFSVGSRVRVQGPQRRVRVASVRWVYLHFYMRI